MSDSAQPAASPSFVRVFLPGLVIGLLIGLAVGAVVPTLLEARSSLGPGAGGAPVAPANPTDRDSRPVNTEPPRDPAVETPPVEPVPQPEGSDKPAPTTP